MSGDASVAQCEFCGARAPADQFHPYWHDEGSPMPACDSCVVASPTDKDEQE